MKYTIKSMVLVSLLAGVASLQAQTSSNVAPQNVVQLSASGSLEVQQDVLSISLNATREAADAATVQNQLKMALDAALSEARKAASPGLLDVRTGNFSLHPRHGRDGRISAWQGSAELVLEGRDFARISAMAGKIQTLTLGQVSFSLSREQRARVEGEAQMIAMERFKAKAAEIARGFGFSGFSLREIAVNADDQGDLPRPRLLSMEAKAAASEAPVPVEAGRSRVLVTVSGTVQLR